MATLNQMVAFEKTLVRKGYVIDCNLYEAEYGEQINEDQLLRKSFILNEQLKSAGIDSFSDRLNRMVELQYISRK